MCHREHCYEFRVRFEEECHQNQMKTIRDQLNIAIGAFFKRPESPESPVYISDNDDDDQDDSDDDDSHSEEEQKEPAKINHGPSVPGIFAQAQSYTQSKSEGIFTSDPTVLAMSPEERAKDLEAELKFYNIKEIVDNPYSSGSFQGYSAGINFF